MNIQVLLALADLVVSALERVADAAEWTGVDLDDEEALDRLRTLQERSEAAGRRIRAAADERSTQ